MLHDRALHVVSIDDANITDAIGDRSQERITPIWRHQLGGGVQEIAHQIISLAGDKLKLSIARTSSGGKAELVCKRAKQADPSGAVETGIVARPLLVVAIFSVIGFLGWRRRRTNVAAVIAV